MLRPCMLRMFLLLGLLAGSLDASGAVRLHARSGAAVLDGESPHLLVDGLPAGELATVHAFRRTLAFQPGTYTGTAILAHAEAIFKATRNGQIDLDTAVPLRGTYADADPLGLLWSGARMETAGLPGKPVTQNLALQSEQDVVLRVEAPSLGADRWVEARIRLTDGADAVEVQDVAMPGLNGAFARPKRASGRPLPAIILLHGSEGGSQAAARASAIRFAQLGYAAFALNYFAWPWAGLQGVPQALVDIPLEELGAVRAWLMKQPNVEAQSLAVWGLSKGAEFALLAASHYDWIDRVVACVPSSVVWSGFGRDPAPGEIFSSWSLAGVGLPFIPYDHYEDVSQQKYSAGFVHRRSLDLATPDQRAAARIPVEKAHASLLLLAASKDVVWPSAAMTTDIEASMHAANRDNLVHAHIFPGASHFICGTGSEPRRINPVHKPEGDDPTPEADAHAAAASWRETQNFLRR